MSSDQVSNEKLVVRDSNYWIDTSMGTIQIFVRNGKIRKLDKIMEVLKIKYNCTGVSLSVSGRWNEQFLNVLLDNQDCGNPEYLLNEYDP